MFVAMVALILRSGGRADALEFIDRSLGIGERQAAQVLDYCTAIAKPLKGGQETLAVELLAGLGSALPRPVVLKIEAWVARNRPTRRMRVTDDSTPSYLGRLAQPGRPDTGA